jgi:serine/threonine protein kinase
MSDLVGSNLGRYHVVEALGQGGMASVYKAYDTSLERNVAIKIIRSDIQIDNQGEFLKRFQREAKSLAKLDHPYILKVLDYGDQEGLPYLVMPFMEGGTLKEQMGQPMPYEKAAGLLAPIARALEYAHSQNIIHRDVKPANVLIGKSGAPILSDFGIAKILAQSGSTQLTGAGVGIGTPDYMAPEQWTGSADSRSDIYSLGVVFYQMVTGHLPFTADTPAAVLIKHLRDPLPRPKSFVHDLPDKVEQILFKALAKEPENRYQGMGEFASALEDIILRKAAPAQENLQTLAGTATAVQAVPRSVPAPLTPAATRIAPVIVPARKSIFLSSKLWLPVVLIVFTLAGSWWLAANWPRPSSPVAAVAETGTPEPTRTEPPQPTRTSRPEATATEAFTPTAEMTSSLEPTSAPAATSTPALRLGQTIATGDLGANRYWGGITFSPDGKEVNLLTTGYGVMGDNFNTTVYSDAKILSFDSNDLGMQAIDLESPPANPIRWMSGFSPDGLTAAVMSEDGMLHFWQISNGKLLQSLKLEGATNKLYRLAFSPDGQILAGVGEKDIYLWKASDGSLFQSLRGTISGYFSGIDFSPDGKLMASAGGTDRVIHLWRISDGALLTSFQEPGSVYSVAFSPDGKILASGLKSGNINLWDIEKGTLLRTLDGTKTSVAEIVFSPDGSYLASTASGAVDLWRMKDGQLLNAIESETAYGMSVEGLAFSPDSQLLAVLSSIGTLRLYGVIP